MKSVLISWSGGKDSALALYYIIKEKRYHVETLLTTISAEYNRISMHGVRKELLKKQAISIGFPIHIIYLPENINNVAYGSLMKREMIQFKSKNINYVVFGDIFLEDIREYREFNLSEIGMNAIFPLWKKSSKDLARQFLDLGFKAIITCVDSNFLNSDFVGQLYDDNFLQALPSNVNYCGENGEFHTFVYDGPLFSSAIQFKKGKVVFREERFYYIDLV